LDKTTVRLENEYRTVIKAREFTWLSDSKTSEGGDESGPTPEELLMGALGACMAITGKMYAVRKGWPLEGVEVTLEFERFNGRDYPGYDGDANFVHEISEDVTLHGPLDDDQKKRVREIMGRCPVRRVLAHPVFFVESESAVPEDETTPEAASS
jgi:putative redox protein